MQAHELRDLIAELHASVRRSQIDWENFLSGKFDSISDKDGMDKVGLNRAAKSWSDTGEKLGALNPSALYTVLCDFGHPNFGSALLCMSNDGFGFAQSTGLPVGTKIFGFLYPSPVALSKEFQKSLDALQITKFEQE